MTPWVLRLLFANIGVYFQHRIWGTTSETGRVAPASGSALGPMFALNGGTLVPSATGGITTAGTNQSGATTLTDTRRTQLGIRCDTRRDPKKISSLTLTHWAKVIPERIYCVQFHLPVLLHVLH